MPGRARIALAVALALAGCAPGEVSGSTADARPRDRGVTDRGPGADSDLALLQPDAAPPDSAPPVTCNGAAAYLHGDAWVYWWNYRVQCDYFHKRYWRCQQAGGTCATEKAEWEACDVCRQVDGVCIPRTRPGESDGCCSEGACCDYSGAGPPAEETYFFGYFRSCRTDCDARDYDYAQLWGHFYGKSWDKLGGWKLEFPDGGVTGGVKGEDKDPQSAPDDALGLFGCYQVPTGKPLRVKVTIHEWGGDNDPGAKEVEHSFTAEPGKHYLFGPTGVKEWRAFDRGPCEGPPKAIADRLGGLSCSNLQ